ncbi:hypothetical protein AB4Z39_10885 [Mycobacterium adipatum]|uniref:hypothetical protein n=1 Tax=Mycobacterium adipatum TaxID=1682113 RepID=UPI0034E0CA37
MNGFSNPEFWSGLSGPGVALLVCAAFVWALSTGRLVLGKQHQAVVARADRYDEANRELVQTVIRGTADKEATVALVTSFQKQLNDLARGAAQ